MIPDPSEVVVGLSAFCRRSLALRSRAISGTQCAYPRSIGMIKPMKRSVILVTALFVFTTLSPQRSLSQGALTPPGPPGPLFKTLDQIEPRMPIAGGTGLGSLVISQPGSYYFTGNRQTAGTAVFVETNGVTIDLNGYSLIGGGANDGIKAEFSDGRVMDRIVIRNGTISGFANGIKMSKARACRIEDMICSGNQGSGVAFLCGTSGSTIGNVITRCQMISNYAVGIYLEGGASAGDVCTGNIISHCTVSSSPGQSGSTTTGLGLWLYGSSTGAIGGTSGNLIEYCTAANNLRTGFLLTASAGRLVGNRIVGCLSTLNGSTGFELNSSGVGRLLGNTITQCQAIGNGSDGFRVAGIGSSTGGNVLSYNQSSGNAGGGFFTSITVGGLTIANFAAGNTNANFSLAVADSNGPVVTTAGTLGNTGNDAHYGANISR